MDSIVFTSIMLSTSMKSHIHRRGCTSWGLRWLDSKKMFFFVREYIPDMLSTDRNLWFKLVDLPANPNSNMWL